MNREPALSALDVDRVVVTLLREHAAVGVGVLDTGLRFLAINPRFAQVAPVNPSS